MNALDSQIHFGRHSSLLALSCGLWCALAWSCGKTASQTELNPAQNAPSAQKPAPTPLVQPRASSSNDVESASDPGNFPGTTLAPDVILRGLRQVEMTAYRPVGSTSTVFRAQTDGAFRVAFKTATHKRPFGPVAEVAAYRLARCLGIRTVPPAVLRRVHVSALQAGLDPEFVSQWRDIAPRLVTDGDGFVEGAVVYWIEGLRTHDLAANENRAAVLRGLQLSEPLATDAPLMASGLSTLQAFDFLIGNWDRWSGGNVKGDATGQILYVRDHDAALAARLSEALQRRLLDPVLATERFSRDFIERLRALTRAAYESELAQDPEFAQHRRLNERNLLGLFDRRAALLSHVSALIEEHGEERVLAFP